MAIKFNRRIKQKAFIDMVPMIDIVFQLVIFFMVATNFKVTSGIELELPGAESVATIATTPLTVTVFSSDKILIFDRETNINGFRAFITDYRNNDTTRSSNAVLYGHKEINYQLLIDVMDILRLEGYTSIDLAVRETRR